MAEAHAALDISEGKQGILPFGSQSEKNKAQQQEDIKKIKDAVEKKYIENFYALDTETSGFQKFRLIQIAVILFQNGKEVKRYNQFYMPKGKITKEAIKIHGLSKKVLKEKGAKEWTKGQSQQIMNFLNLYKDYPIIAHYVKHDRDDVLRKAFEEAKNLENFPKDERWRCTWQLAKDLPGMRGAALDEVLEYCNHEPREEDGLHDAVEDAQLAGIAYMDLMKMPPIKTTSLGFAYE